MRVLTDPPNHAPGIPQMAAKVKQQTLVLHMVYIGVRGKPERDMESLRMIGWGLLVVESSSAAVAAAVPPSCLQ